MAVGVAVVEPFVAQTPVVVEVAGPEIAVHTASDIPADIAHEIVVLRVVARLLVFAGTALHLVSLAALSCRGDAVR